ncbi:hypothetical protein ANN_04225 [Periplaneta americana]|uniref:Uncharacterized protein n=1 Tax=Periplaneta americana TaxID=6978 RepID=A0ABQ8T9H3_PERAM|nr:hypothetical protein ANN_04225 [Periplaneta americana]
MNSVQYLLERNFSVSILEDKCKIKKLGRPLPQLDLKQAQTGRGNLVGKLDAGPKVRKRAKTQLQRITGGENRDAMSNGQPKTDSNKALSSLGHISENGLLTICGLGSVWRWNFCRRGGLKYIQNSVLTVVVVVVAVAVAVAVAVSVAVAVAAAAAAVKKGRQRRGNLLSRQYSAQTYVPCPADDSSVPGELQYNIITPSFVNEMGDCGDTPYSKYIIPRGEKATHEHIVARSAFPLLPTYNPHTLTHWSQTPTRVTECALVRVLMRKELFSRNFGQCVGPVPTQHRDALGELR